MEKLYYISQENNHLTHLEGIKNACEAGVKWIQLRIKDRNENEILQLAKEAKQICDVFGATLIINDYPHIAKQINAGGVHVGKEDMSIADARKLLGKDFIIGGTANTLEDVVKHVNEGADYIGLGPYQFTNTKKKLSSILGMNGIRKIISKSKEKNITVPVFAIGGIEPEDIQAIMATGVAGIAVSGIIANAKNPKEVVQLIHQKLNKSNLPC